MDKKQQRQQEIKRVMLNYVNGNEFNVSKFRTDNKSVYNRINYNFGSLEAAIESLETDMGYSLIIVSESGSSQLDLTAPNLRNKLAYEQLRELRKGHTLQEIAEYYNCTRSLVNQTWQALSKEFSHEKSESSDN